MSLCPFAERNGAAGSVDKGNDNAKLYKEYENSRGVRNGGNDTVGYCGINSARERLENLCGGTLTIESTLGVGTTAIVQIPKGGKDKA